MAINISQAVEKNKSPRELRREGATEREILQVRKQQKIFDQQLIKQAKNVEQQIKSNFNKFSNLSAVKKEIDKLPPRIKSKISMSKFQKIQQKKVKTIENQIKRAEERLKDAKKDEDRARDRDDDRREDRAEAEQDRYRTEIRELQKFVPKLKKGEIIDERKIIQFANDKGRAEERKERAKQQRRKQQKDIAKQLKSGAGNVTSINFETGKVTVDGKDIKLKSSDVKDLKLTAIREAEGKKKLDALESKAKEGKTVKQLKEEGFNNQEIAEIGRFELLDNVLKASQERKLTTNELKVLNLTDEQIKLINQRGELTGRDFREVLSGSREQRKKQLDLINDVRERNKFFDELKNQQQERVVSDFLDKLNNPPSSPSEVLGIYTQTQNVFDVSPIKLRRDQEFNKYLRSEFRKAKLNNPGAKASLLGLGALISSGQVITTDFAIWTGELISTAYNTITDADSRKKVIDNVIELNKKAQKNTLQQNFNASKDFIGTGVKATQSYFTELGKNVGRGDPFAIAEAVLLLAPVGVPIKASKVAKNSKNINSFSNEIVQQVNPKTKYFDSKINYKQNLGKGSGTLKIETKGVTQKGIDFKNEISLSYQPKNRTLVGTSKTSSGGVSSTININLIDRGTYYEDKKNKIKIPKSRIKAENLRGKIIENKTKIDYKKKQKNIGFAGELIVGEKTKQITKLAKQGEKIKNVDIKQTVLIEQALGINKAGEYVNEIAKRGKIQSEIKSSLKKAPKQRTPKDYENIVKIMEALQWDKKILNGIDKRTRFAYALGLNKKSLPISIKQFENNIKDGYVVKRSGVAYAEASFNKMKPKKFTLGPSFVFNNLNGRLSTLRNNKKAQVRLKAVELSPIIKKAKKTQTGALKLPQEIQLPQIDSLIFLPKKLNKGVKIPSKFKIIAQDLGVAQDYSLITTQKGKQVLTLQEQVKNQIQNKIPQQVKELIKLKPIQEQRKIQNKIKNLQSKNKPITLKNLNLNPFKIRRVRTPPNIDLPRTNRKDKNAFLLVYTKGGRKVGSKSLFPENRAIKRAVALMNQNKSIKKVELQKRGKTAIKDINDKKPKGYEINKLKTRIDVLRAKK